MVLKGSVNFGPRGSTALGFGGHAHRAFPALEYLESDKLITLNENTLREGENRLREQARTTMSPLAKAKAVLPFARKKILVDVGSGLTEVYVREIDSAR